jgi:putative hydrolase of HD superfamily
MSKTKNKTSQLVNFFYEMGTLRKIPRAHMQALFTTDVSDNIASHSFRVSVIGYFLALAEKVDPNKVTLMCLFHDMAETRSGDQNWIHKRYVKVFEEEIIQDQLNTLPFNKQLIELLEEYEKRESLESKIAKDADLLDQMFLLREYTMQGNLEAKTWMKGKDDRIKRLSTKTGKKLGREIYKQDPSDWWRSIWTSTRR